MTTSAPLDCPAATPSCTTAPASLPCFCRMTRQPARLPHSSNCSLAAALNVSPATRMDSLPSSCPRALRLLESPSRTPLSHPFFSAAPSAADSVTSASTDTPMNTSDQSYDKRLHLP